MTVLIAVSQPDSKHAVIFSDSQGSTDTEEMHGAQKIYAGEDFLLGGAGIGPVISRLFETLHKDSTVTSADVASRIEQFLHKEINEVAKRGVEFLLLTAASSGIEPAIQHILPALFNTFGSRTDFRSIGSGATQVSRAMSRDNKNCIPPRNESLADLMFTASNLAEAATESLTVDEFNLVGVLREGRTYLLSHAGIRPVFLAPALVPLWSQISAKFAEFNAIISTARGELRNAQSAMLPLFEGKLSILDTAKMVNSSMGIHKQRVELEKKLKEYFDWYDTQLKRTIIS